MSLVNFFSAPVRTARARITLAGADITRTLDPAKLTFTYKDEAMGKADSVQLELEDVERSWIDENFSEKGAKLEAAIQVYNWRAPGDNLEQRCGSFTVDSVSFKGPPNTLTLSANSIPTNTKIKSKNTTRAWENTTFRKVADQVAEENGMQVEWETQQEPQYKRLEQMDQSDLAFIQRHANECGLAVKITDNKIVFFDEEDYEAKDPVDTIAYGGVNILSWSFNSKLTDCVAGATCAYQNPETGQLTKEEFTPQNKPNTGGLLADHDHPGYESDWAAMTGASLKRFAPLSSLLPRQGFGLMDWNKPDPTQQKGKGAGGKKVGGRRAKKLARKKNKNENTAQFLVVGNPLLCAGKTVKVEGFGRYSGKYIIQSATHKLGGGGYTTDISLTLTLEGY